MCSSKNRRLGRWRAVLQKVEVTALVRLGDVVDIKLAVAAGVFGLGLFPCGAAGFEFGVIHVQMNFSIGHVEFDFVAGLHERQRTAHVAFGCEMQYAHAVAGATHTGIGKLEQPPVDAMATLRHSRWRGSR